MQEVGPCEHRQDLPVVRQISFGQRLEPPDGPVVHGTEHADDQRADRGFAQQRFGDASWRGGAHDGSHG